MELTTTCLHQVLGRGVGSLMSMRSQITGSERIDWLVSSMGRKKVSGDGVVEAMIQGDQGHGATYSVLLNI